MKSFLIIALFSALSVILADATLKTLVYASTF